MISPARRHTALPPPGTLLVWAVIGLAVFGLALLFPPTSDDWARIAFGDRTLAGYVDQALGSYQNHNGRVLGNTLSLLLIEPAWLRAAAKAVVVVALVAMMQLVVRSRSVWVALASFAGVFLLPAGVFRESYVWSAGFFNYVPPMVGLLLLVAVVGRRWPAESAELRRPWLTGVGCAVVGFAASLFIEHVTVTVLAIALAGLGVQVALRRWSAPVLGWAVGAVAGTVVMFAAPGLDKVGSGEDSYFSYADSLQELLTLGLGNYATITSSFVFSNPVLLGLLTTACVLAGVRRPGRGGVRTAADVAVVAGSLAVASYAVLSRALTVGALTCGADACDRALLAVDLVAMVLLLVVLVVAGHRYLPTADRAVWYLLLVATVLMLGPLLVVAPIGPRNVFGPTVTVVALGVLLGVRAVSGLGRRGLWLLRAGIAAVVVAGLTVQVVVQSANNAVAAERVQILTEAVESGRRSVQVPGFRHPDWVHNNRDPKMGEVYYIDVPRDIEITLR